MSGKLNGSGRFDVHLCYFVLRNFCTDAESLVT